MVGGRSSSSKMTTTELQISHSIKVSGPATQT